MPARILVIGQLPPPVHGSNVMTQRFMEALRQGGFETTIVQKAFSQSLEEVGTVTLSKVMRIPDLCHRVHVEIRNHKPDYCVYFITVGLRSLLVDCLVLGLLRMLKVPYILYFHGKGYSDYEAPRYAAVRGFVHSALNGSLGGVVLGERLKEDVKHCIPDSKLLVLPNGIPPIDDRQDKLVNDDDAVVRIVFLSNLIPTKGPMRFLEMAKLVCEQEPGVRFIMAGRPASEQYLSELKDRISNEGLGDWVSLPGPVYGADKERLLRETDIFVFPTVKDVFPIVVLEAMQRGIPVVSSPVGAIPDVIRDGVNGYIVDPADISSLAERVLRLVRDIELRKTMGTVGRTLFEENYSLDAYISNTKQAMDFFMKLKQAECQAAPVTPVNEENVIQDK